MLRASLLAKLLLAILLPALLTFAGFAVLGHIAAARALEAELGRRLAALASVTAAQISEDSVAILAEGDENSRTYRNLRRKLVEVRDAAGVARVYLFASDGTARVDSGDLPIGSRDYSLQTSQVELRRVFGATSSEAGAVSSVLFRGKDGALYKSGFAPVRPADASAAVRFALGVDGSAALYSDLLGLRKTLLGVGLLGAVLLVLLAVGLGLRITRPLRRLREDARRMGAGVLDQSVWQPGPLAAQGGSGGDEVAELARALDVMRKDLLLRDERLRMMLAGIAHEVRNPLGGMELFAGLLAEELAQAGEREPGQSPSGPGPDLPAARGYVQRVQKELRHLQAVVNDFLEYARRPRPQLAPVRLVELLAEVRDSAAALAPAHVSVELLAASGEDSALSSQVVHVDANQLRRALLNLTQNAVQACAAASDATHPAKKHVEIAAAPDPQKGGITLWVRDDGPGIPAELHDKIWAPFFTTKAQGTGLGLAFVREIVEDHGGQIRLEQASSGTCFCIQLPSSAGAASPRVERAYSGGPTDSPPIVADPARPNPP
ncbi:MAG: HAMP domain-containing histidine kinase [Myxococcales bacterium]|nr:HAMP domain-containing histidine kinase [Myxococcales bacterium]